MRFADAPRHSARARLSCCCSCSCAIAVQTTSDARRNCGLAREYAEKWRVQNQQSSHVGRTRLKMANEPIIRHTYPHTHCINGFSVWVCAVVVAACGDSSACPAAGRIRTYIYVHRSHLRIGASSSYKQQHHHHHIPGSSLALCIPKNAG